MSAPDGERSLANASALQAHLRGLGTPEAAAIAARYFKTGPGQYGEGDVFLGIRVPVLRKLAREHRALPTDELVMLLRSAIHEERLLALLILVESVSKANEATKREVYDLYLAHTAHINNWDLVDSSARDVVGGYLHDKDRSPLYRLARSASLWERRIAIIATHHFIARDDFADTLAIAEILLDDRHDLIHKATGWMLREVGKRNEPALARFLRRHAATMPRTMLRYAIERYPADVRKAYLKGEA
ncbi:MAG: DNA alkylation repair protein [Isosphaeraceae bacterium]|nr:DNA alkylation repair protein [Isosphaeraceae bacterium]